MSIDCTLSSNEIIFQDSANTVTVVADADVGWPDKSLTAVRSVKIVNSRTGATYVYHADPAVGDFGTIASTSGVTVNPNSVIDATTKMRVRVERLSDDKQPNPEYWINVYIRGAELDTSGVCISGCTPAKRTQLISNRRLEHASTVCSSTLASGKPLAGVPLANCIRDVAATGNDNWAKSAASSQINIAFEDRVDTAPAAPSTSSAAPSTAPAAPSFGLLLAPSIYIALLAIVLMVY